MPVGGAAAPLTAAAPIALAMPLPGESEVAQLLRLLASGSLFAETGESDADVSARAPELYMCPISGELMLDPVLDSAGHTFSRAAITEWIKRRTADHQPLTSPLSNAPITALVTPVHVMRGQIIEWVQAQRRGAG